MKKSKWFLLQLFAGEGAGASAGASGGEGSGEGTATGENSVDAEHQRLRELGVPEEKLRKRAKRANVTLPEGAVRTTPMKEQEQMPQQQVATATENPTEEQANDTAPKRMSWEEIMADPEYNKQMQQTIQSRLKNAKNAEAVLAKMTPALEVLARKHGQDPENPDYEALAKAINDDDAYYEDKALEMGVSVETAKRLDQKARDDARQQKQEQQDLEQQRIHAHFQKMEQQAEALKKVFPSFDLRVEMQNPAFVRMTAPGTGIMSVEDAYRAIHRKEIEAAQSQVIAQQTAQKISNAIQAGSRRPDENGTSSRSPSVTTFNYAKASKAQREAFKQRIYAAAARGEKLYPGR